jgi:DNA-binding response OmpR family regulator
MLPTAEPGIYPTPVAGRVILIVDDNPTVTRALAALLARNGMEAQTFEDATGALVYAEGHKPAAAVVDIHLPDMSGLVLSQKLRERFGADWPIIVLSGDVSRDTLNSLATAGATYFFSKPVSAQNLLNQLKELVG